MRARRLAAAAAPFLVAVAPVVVATARAVSRDWIPVGDNAFFAFRARDVLTEHHPLLGAWSSGSQAVGVDVNNLGPLQVELLAAPIRVLGYGTGTAVGVALVNVLAAVTVVLFTRRRLGPLGAWAGAGLVTATAWTMGSEVLFEPRQHHALVLPFLAYVVSAWAVAAGDRWALVPLVGAGSLVAQTHLTFVLPTALLGLVALVMGIVAHRRVSWRPAVWWAGALAALCWIQTAVEELRGGEGNVSALWRASQAEQESYGLRRGVRVTAATMLPPDGWWRSSFRDLDPGGALPGLWPSVLALLALFGGAVVVAIVARRRDQAMSAWGVMAAAAVVVAVAGATTMTVSGPFGAAVGNLRFLWPLSVFVTMGGLVAVLRLTARGQRIGVPLLAIVAAVFAVAAVPTSFQSPGVEADAPLIPAASAIYEQLADAELEGPVLFERGRLYFGEPFSFIVLTGLQAGGTEVVFDEPVDLARFGSERAVDERLRGRVVLRAGGDPALEDLPGATLLARVVHPDDPGHGNAAVWFVPADPDQG